MRACTFAFYLSLLTPVLAAPLAIPEAVAAPALIADGSASSAPLVVRSFVEREDDEAEEGALAAFVADEDDKVSEDACSAVCATHYIAGAKTEREALCSPKGLQNTLDCALCIDNTWPDTTWQESAMAEYERIVEACEQAPQKVLRKSNRK